MKIFSLRLPFSFETMTANKKYDMLENQALYTFELG
jgi:hypothetical protein